MNRILLTLLLLAFSLARAPGAFAESVFTRALDPSPIHKEEKAPRPFRSDRIRFKTRNLAVVAQQKGAEKRKLHRKDPTDKKVLNADGGKRRGAKNIRSSSPVE